MSDLLVTTGSELMVAHVEADGGEDAVEFLDGYQVRGLYVVDSGRIIIPLEALPDLKAAALQRGLTYEEEKAVYG